MSNRLLEGTKEIIELNKLAGDIIAYIISRNESSIRRWHHWYVNSNSNFEVDNFDVPYMYIAELSNLDKYEHLSDFISGNRRSLDTKFYLSIEFARRPVGNNRAYYEGGSAHPNIVILFPTDEFNDELSYRFSTIDGEPSIGTLSDYVKIIMLRLYKGSLVHELQHAYDDWRSGGNFIKDKASSDYYSSKQSNAATSTDQDEIFRRYRKYLALPHEYWARLTQTISNIGYLIHGADFTDATKEFKSAFLGWDYLDYDAKKRLLKVFYKYWDELNKNRRKQRPLRTGNA